MKPFAGKFIKEWYASVNKLLLNSGLWEPVKQQKLQVKKSVFFFNLNQKPTNKLRKFKVKPKQMLRLIYANAYDQGPQASEFYAFLKTLETYRQVLNSDMSMILTTDSPLFRLLKSSISPEDNKLIE